MKKYLFKSLVLAAVMCVFSLEGYTQNKVYKVSNDEYEQLKKSPGKLDEIKKEGYEIQIVDLESPVSKTPVTVKVTTSELASYKSDPKKYQDFLNSTGGLYEVVPDEQPQASRIVVQPNPQDLEKIKLEKGLRDDSSGSDGLKD